MAIGKRKPTQDQLPTPTAQLARSPGHPFYRKLNEMSTEARFDEFAEKLCAPFYKEGGRPSLPPGTYFRLLFIGHIESFHDKFRDECLNRELFGSLAELPSTTTQFVCNLPTPVVDFHTALPIPS